MNARSIFCSAVALILSAGNAAAQASDQKPMAVLPDPTTIKIPDLSLDAPDLDSEGNAKYSYFHRANVNFETAVADLAECSAYATEPDTLHMPAFIVLEETAPRQRPQPISPYGLVGQAMVAVLMPSLNRRAHEGGMRLCMGYKNYRRYPLSKALYLALYENDPANAIFIQAKIASGPAPKLASIAP